jgi:hypothetical protein
MLRRADYARAVHVLLAAVAALPLYACGTAQIRVRSAPISTTRTTTDISPAGLALSIDEQIAAYHGVTRTSAVGAGPGYGTIEVDFELGAALSGVIDEAVRAHFREVTASPSCIPGSGFLLRAEFAKPPEVHIHWLQRMISEGGGATVDLALSLSAQRCEGPVVWRSIVTGYGAAELIEYNLLWTTPAAEQFQPAVEQALTDLARHLDATLSAAAQNELAAPPS